MIAIAGVGAWVARNAPTSAPSVVAISRNIPIRMLEKPSLTYAAAAPEEVGSGLLRAIRDSGVWIEQEAVAETVLRGEKADYNRK